MFSKTRCVVKTFCQDLKLLLYITELLCVNETGFYYFGLEDPEVLLSLFRGNDLFCRKHALASGAIKTFSHLKKYLAK